MRRTRQSGLAALSVVADTNTGTLMRIWTDIPTRAWLSTGASLTRMR